VNTSVTVNDTTGAAISLWTSLTGVSARARLSLERDRIIAGRVVAAAGPLDGLQVSSEGNDLTIHQALLSCAGFIDPDCWRKLPPWRGRDNRYHGHGNRLLVDGTAVDVTALPAWREYSHLNDALAPEAAPASPFQTALREPAN